MRDPIVIVGAGPVGLSLANLLGVAGVPTVVVEAHEAPMTEPRAVHFDAEIMRVFQAMGVAEQMSAIVRRTPIMRFVDESGDTLFSVEWGLGAGAQGWPHSNLFHQPDLEDVLRAALDRFPHVEVRYGRRFVGWERHADGLEVRTVGLAGDEELVCAAMLVGCDGASSSVRRSIGASWVELGPAQPWLVLDAILRSDDGALPEWPVQYPWPERPHFFMRNTGNRVRWEFKLMPGDDPDEIIRPDRLRTLIGSMVDPDTVDVERAATYTFRSMIADRWQAGDVFIAGDAAHLQPPFLAQGMCSGIRDASQLAWKLERAWRRGDRRFLDDYQVEREPHARAWIAEATRVSELCQVIDAAEAAQRNAMLRASDTRLAPIVPGLGRGAAFAANAGPVGELSPQFRSPEGLLSDDTGTGRFLLVAREVPSEPLPEEVAVVPVSLFPDAAAFLDEHGAWAALIRPDRYVAGVARGAADVPALVASVETEA